MLAPFVPTFSNINANFEAFQGGVWMYGKCLFFSGFAGILVGHPADTVKVRIQAQTPTNIRYKGTFDCFAEIIRKESVSLATILSRPQS